MGFWERKSFGFGVEYIFAEHSHYALLSSISINAFSYFIVDDSPVLLFVEHEGQTKKHFVTHLELTYELVFGEFGIGPVVKLGITEEETHYSVGIHLGKGF